MAQFNKFTGDISSVFAEWGENVWIPLEEKNAALARELADQIAKANEAKVEAFLYKQLYLKELKEKELRKKEVVVVKAEEPEFLPLPPNVMRGRHGKRRSHAEVDRELREMVSTPKHKKRRVAPHGMRTHKDFFNAAFEIAEHLE